MRAILLVDKLALQVLSSLAMTLKMTAEVRAFYKQLTSLGGKARAKKYDHSTLSEWAKRGGRPRKDSHWEDAQGAGASPGRIERQK